MSIEQILAQRGKTHGEFRDQASCAQELKEVWHRHAKECGNGMNLMVNEAVDMILHKLARAATGALLEPDHWLDVQGYAKLVSDRIPAMAPPKPNYYHSMDASSYAKPAIDQIPTGVETCDPD